MIQSLPCSQDTELAVLACALERPEQCMATITESLGDDMNAFYIPSHQMLYMAMVMLWSKDGKFDAITLNNCLAQSGEQDRAGGAALIGELMTQSSVPILLEKYLTTLKAAAIRRTLILELTAVASAAYDLTSSLEPLMEQAETAVMKVRQFAKGSTSGLVSVKKPMMEALDEIQKAKLGEAQPHGISTGFKAIDAKLGGFRPGTLHLIGARPGMGKSALMMGMAEDMAWNRGLPVGVFSLEMSAAGLMHRSLASQSGIAIGDLMGSNQLSMLQMQRLATAAENGNKGTMFVDDTASVTILDLRSRVRQGVINLKINAAFVDYAQLVKGSTKRSQDNRVDEIGEISRGLKMIAKECNIPIVALVQLNRVVESRPDNMPKLSDLKGSGDLEQDADSVSLLFRQDYYDKGKFHEADQGFGEEFEPNGDALCIVAKNRSGETGNCWLKFDGERTKFSDR
tara:strand:+ start:36541 stop:37908 length:1368 start_codon:yes stop_codon:yes gene_type:complete